MKLYYTLPSSSTCIQPLIFQYITSVLYLCFPSSTLLYQSEPLRTERKERKKFIFLHPLFGTYYSFDSFNRLSGRVVYRTLLQSIVYIFIQIPLLSAQTKLLTFFGSRQHVSRIHRVFFLRTKKKSMRRKQKIQLHQY